MMDYDQKAREWLDNMTGIYMPNTQSVSVRRLVAPYELAALLREVDLSSKVAVAQAAAADRLRTLLVRARESLQRAPVGYTTNRKWYSVAEPLLAAIDAELGAGEAGDGPAGSRAVVDTPAPSPVEDGL